MDAFLTVLPRDAPPLAQLLDLRSMAIALQSDSAFVIRVSTHGDVTTAIIPPDTATAKTAFAN